MRKPFSPVVAVLAALFAKTHGAIVWSPLTTQNLPEVKQTAFLPSQGFSLKIQAPAGNYQLSYSQNMGSNTWQNLTALHPTEGISHYLHGAAASRQRGFYRVSGNFTSEAYHAIIPALTLEWGYEDLSEPSARGDLVAEIRTGTGSLDYQNPPSALSHLKGGNLSQQYLSPILGGLEAYRENTRQSDFDPVILGQNSWSANIPAGLYLLPYAAAEGDPFAYTCIAMEPQRASLVAAISRSYAGTLDFGVEIDAQEFSGRKLAMPFLIRKSHQANAADLNGPWGFVRLGVGSFLFEEETYQAAYQTAVGTAQITASSATAAVFTIAKELSLRIEQPYTLAEDIQSYDDEILTPSPLPLLLDGNGQVEIGTLENKSQGAASPTTDLMVLTRAATTPEEGQDVGFFTPETTMESEVTLAVRREITPNLAGKSYQVTRLGLSIKGGSFILQGGTNADQITFNPNGTSATFSGTLKEYAVTFDGESSSRDAAINRTYSVTFEPDGMITLTHSSGTFAREFKGFAQVGNNQIILRAQDSHLILDEQEIALLVLVKLPSTPLP